MAKPFASWFTVPKMWNRRSPKHSPKRQRGQILIIVAFAIIGLVAFVGLVVDTGLVFIGYGALRRSVDAAALAAAAQYRKNPNPTGLAKAAKEFLVLNNVPNADATVYVCNETYPTYHDPSLCTTPARRRLVKVNAATQVPLAFLPVIGINSIRLTATATSEAASLDITLVLDVSESMTWDSPDTSLLRDPSECNANRDPLDGTTTCLPFQQIQRAAMDFVGGPADPLTGVRNGVGGLIGDTNSYDRVAVIPFSRVVNDDAANYNKPLHLDANVEPLTLTPAQYRAKIVQAIADLSVYQASDGGLPAAGPYADGSCLGGTPPQHVPCRYYIPDSDLTSSNCGYDLILHAATGGYDFSNTACFTLVPPGSPIAGSFVDLTDPLNPVNYERAFTLFTCDTESPDDRKYCGTSNIGGGFWASGQEFVGKLPVAGAHPKSFRQESLWVVILLSDGVANHANGSQYCPLGADYTHDQYWCQDYGPGAVSTRHCLPSNDVLYTGFPALFNSCTLAPPEGGGGSVNASLFDADDYARAMADYVALGQQALIFTIGYDDSGLLGHSSPGNDYGEQLLNYAADVGDDGKINTVGLNPNYFYYDPLNVSQTLGDIFTAITNQIATRLQK